MAKIILGMTTSLDGFVADEDGSAGRLYPDLAALSGTAYMTISSRRLQAIRDLLDRVDR